MGKVPAEEGEEAPSWGEPLFWGVPPSRGEPLVWGVPPREPPVGGAPAGDPAFRGVTWGPCLWGLPRVFTGPIHCKAPPVGMVP
jgi:hypothetical protein